MINIRKNLFETNSSSVHALVIPKDQKIYIPTTVILRYGDYGWEFDTYYDTIDYIYTACKDRGDKEVEKLINYLKHKGVEEIIVSEQDNDSWGIDHSYEVPLDDLFNNENLLDRFLFGADSYVQTGNDNSDECDELDELEKDSSLDVLYKYN